MPKLEKLITVVGPTASGKTKLSIKLAKKFSGEIISADSRSVYKELNIGTDKPKFEKRNGLYTYKEIPHYLINIIRIDQKFSVAEFKKLASLRAKEIYQKGKYPFLVGGTGLYIKSVVENYSFPGIIADKDLRKELEKTADQKGLDFLWKKLLKLDPGSEEIIDKNNPRRVIRALEVCLKKEKPFSKTRNKNKPQFNTLEIGIEIKKETLDKKIDNRVNNMIKSGLIKEVKKLVQKYGFDNIILQNTIGYQEVIPYLKNKSNLQETIKKIQTNTKQFSRRQLTWFKKQKNINWIKNFKQAENLVKDFLN